MTDRAALEKMQTAGYCEFPDALDPRAAANLCDAVMATRRFDGSLFLTEAEWEASPKTHKFTNPGPGFNVLERFPEKLRFVEQSAALRPFLTALLGEGYRFINHKLVCRLSWSAVPEWLQRRVRGKACNTFGAYVHQQHRDVIYFLENDLHQDIQDWNRLPQDKREHRFVTLYVYLGDVAAHDAPVHILPGTHLLGATPFQHDIRHDAAADTWIYQDGAGGRVEGKMDLITGKTGHTGIWHPCLIHGGPPIKDGNFRVSLRYLVARDPNAKTCALDDINRAVKGPLFLEEDQTPGARASQDGQWNMRMTDFIRYGYAREGIDT